VLGKLSSALLGFILAKNTIRQLVEKVTVYEDKFTVEFKSGVIVDVNE
jgi:hypothetical protein